MKVLLDAIATPRDVLFCFVLFYRESFNNTGWPLYSGERDKERNSVARRLVQWSVKRGSRGRGRSHDVRDGAPAEKRVVPVATSTEARRIRGRFLG